MLLSLRLKQFRSYKDASFEFGSGVNIIVGPNASGKTNLLEAILVLARGGSYRAADSDLIMFNKPWLRLDGTLDNGEGRTVKIVRGEPKTTKTYDLDGKQFTRLTMQHTLPVVLFEPNHLLLLNGQPDARRQYLDDLLEQTKPEFGAARRHYKRVLAQRNALLKRNPSSIENQIFIWNVRLSELGGYIARERMGLVSELNKRLSKLYKDMARSKTKVGAEYQSTLPFETYETALLRKLEASLEQDIVRGFTAAGPHRDDFSVSFNGTPAVMAASRGETRTALLAMKVFELEVTERSRGLRPLLLLDDVFSELDGKRRHALTDYLQNYQAFITTTDADLVAQNFAQTASLIALSEE